MKTNIDGEIPEYSLAPRGRKHQQGGGGGGWVFGILMLLAAGGAGYYAFLQQKNAEDAATRARSYVQQLKELDAKQKDLTTKLDAAESERQALAAAKDELSKNVASKDEELAKLKGTYDQLQDKLKGELKSGDVVLSEDGGKLRVGLVDKVLFNSGEATINKRGENVLMRVGSILKDIADKQIQVSGHTDVLPIGEKRAAQFPTNWELSTARATNVVRFLQEKAGVPGERLAATGYAEFHPVASNKTSTGRARNRRIEILLTPSVVPKLVSKEKLKAQAATAQAETKHKK